MTRRILHLCTLFLFAASFLAHAQTVTTFEGLDAAKLGKPELDVDPNGAIGTKQYMEWVNVYFQAYDKTTFAPVWSKPQVGTSPWVNNGITNCSGIEGDGIVSFDRLASRWIIAGRSSSPAYYYCVAISNTDDLSSSSLAWYAYAFPLNTILGTNKQGHVYFPDWPKFGTWSDAYYVAIDLEDPNAGFQEVGVVACALDRADMLIGATADTPQCFREPSNPNTSMYLGHSFEPADIDGTTTPPAGSPEYFASIENPVNDGVTITSDAFNLWQFHVDWSNPANSTFTQTSVPVDTYTPGCYTAKAPVNTICVPESTTATSGNYIDSVGDRFMYRFAYRNFGSYQSYLISHAIQTGTGSLSQTGIRWYELRGSGVPGVFQSGTISPDQSLYRFMPSIAQDQMGNAAVGYSISSATTHPGISASWWNLPNQTTPTEISLYSGAGDEENSYHWGDYTSMTVDPVNGCTFWYVNEYFAANQTGSGRPIWQTRISNFTVPPCGTIILTPTSLSFGPQAVGTTSASQSVVLANNLSTALTINSIFGSGTNPSDFGQTNNCGTSVAAGGTCTINVTFTPTATGTRAAILKVSDNGPGSPQTVSLSGAGTSGTGLTLSTTSINFGNQAFGMTSPASPIDLTNNGSSAITFTSIAVSGTNSASFGESDNCQPSLAANSTCTINVTFAPPAIGSYSAAVVITDNAANSPQQVALAGTGVAPVTLSSTGLGFGTVLIGNSNTAPPVTLTNQMSVALTGISIVISGSGYSQVNTCGSSLGAGQQCTITVTFAPTGSGQKLGTVTITDSASTSPQTISLTGFAEVPVNFNPVTLNFGTVTVGTTSAPESVTVTNNQKTTLTLDSFVLGGGNPGDFAQTATTCGSTLAPGVRCTVTYTFTPAASGMRTAKVTVTDSAATSPQIFRLTGTGD